MKTLLKSIPYNLIGFLAKAYRLIFGPRKGNYRRMRMFDITEPSVRHLGSCMLRHEVVDGVMTYTLIPRVITNKRKIIYLHGGAYISGPVLFHWQMLGRMCEITGSEITVVLYRKSPEHTYPAQMNDLLSVYDEIRKTADPADICIMGDSAGGNLAAATTLKLRDDGLPLPGFVVLLSPWLDITLSNPDIPKLEKKDKFLDRASVTRHGNRYAGSYNRFHPYLSPVYGDLTGFPKTLLMIGTMDLLLFDCRKFRDNALAAGVDIEYQEWDNMFHDWMCLTSILSEAEESVYHIAGFLSQ